MEERKENQEQNEFKKLSREELEKLLKEKRQEYEDAEEMKEFLLKYTTNHHVPGYTHNEYMTKLQRLEKEIEHIKQLIEEKG